MDKIRLGRTGLMVTRSGFGAIPIQRVSYDDAKKLLVKAYNSGINFYDTARGYSDSEEKIGQALSEVRSNIIIATKSGAKDKAGLMLHLEQSLKNLKTDYIDIYQLHNPRVLPDSDDPESAYAGALEAKKKGMVRFIGITQHSFENAQKAIDSDLYDTLQFPFSMLSSDDDIALVRQCEKKDMGFIAMKALAGGLITNSKAAFAFIRQYASVVPIWGIEHMHHLDEFISYETVPPVLDEAMQKAINADRAALSGSFCRACGYCLPCPSGINIPMAARIGLMMHRMPYRQFLSGKTMNMMAQTEKCTECGTCKTRCPYGLDIPVLIKSMYGQYKDFYAEHQDELPD